MSKLDKRAISILVIAILTLSFVLPLVSVSADEIYLDAVFATSGDSTATWAVDATYGDVVKLDTVGPAIVSDYAIVRIDVDSGLTLGTIVADLPTFMYNLVVADTSRNWLALEMLFTDGADGWAEISIFPYVSAVKWANTPTGTWMAATGHSGETLAMAYGYEDDGITSLDQTATSTSLTDVIAALVAKDGVDGTWELTRVGVQLGWVPIDDQTALIDCIEVEGVTYNLEVVTPGTGFTIDYVTPGDVDYGDILTVMGSGVTSGSLVELYWDTAVGTGAHLLNTTEGNPDGTFDCTVKVPSDKVGPHYLWVKDVATLTTVSEGPINMVPLVKLSPTSGLVGDEITVSGYGFAAEKDVTVTFNITNPTAIGVFETDELGYFTCKFNVPQSQYSTLHKVRAREGTYDITADFTVGASITLTPDEGPTGTVVKVEGRGWTPLEIMVFTLGGKTVEVVNKAEVKVSTGGKFSANVVIPGMTAEGKSALKATEFGTSEYSSVDFDVTGIQEIVVSPTYGSPGATITVKGYNFTQISGTDVIIELRVKGITTHKADLVTAETNSDGTFEDTFMSPAVAFTGYDVYAEDSYYHIAAKDAFKVGLIAMIINPIHGEAGTKVAITGIGFASDPSPADFNMTFGEKLYEYTDGVIDEAISKHFYVPNVAPGTYDVTVIDEDENSLMAQFTVTAVTEVKLDPAMAPNTYNVTIKGYNFADYEDIVDFVLFNATEEWDMDVWQDGDGNDRVKTGTDGNFTAWWEVLDKDTLSLGDYTVNVTGYDDFILQVPFSVVEARVSVAPRKLEFDRGDTIQFDVKNDFDFKESYMKIWDPYDNLYWKTEVFGNWLKVGDLYTVPYYLQTSGMNPMTLSQDAPLGAWFYVFYEKGTTQLTNGTFTVGPSASAQVEEKLTQIWASMEDLSTDIDSITDELAGDISDLSGDIDDVVADVKDMIDDITADLAEDLAGVASDTEAAVDELEGAIGDIAAAQNELASDIGDMGQDTAAAREAAEDAQSSVQGVTTLVYGAIAASLIAALAAVVSLMQISKKIA